ncbi:hypothetical protein, partial [Mediterranea massiliensis]|uniref:hypothetical protein n=1 Tax=Mediterranea massiliensis TaxID=1841865 RepID=UPI001961FED1
KHESRGLSIEKLVISLYTKGMSVSDIEEEMREIYEIEHCCPEKLYHNVSCLGPSPSGTLAVRSV